MGGGGGGAASCPGCACGTPKQSGRWPAQACPAGSASLAGIATPPRPPQSTLRWCRSASQLRWTARITSLPTPSSRWARWPAGEGRLVQALQGWLQEQGNLNRRRSPNRPAGAVRCADTPRKKAACVRAFSRSCQACMLKHTHVPAGASCCGCAAGAWSACHSTIGVARKVREGAPVCAAL